MNENVRKLKNSMELRIVGKGDVIDKIIIALKMDSLINDAVKGIILIIVILIQVAGPQLKERFSIIKAKSAN